MPDNAYLETDDNANFLKCRGPHRITVTGQAIDPPRMKTQITMPGYQLIPDRIKLVVYPQAVDTAFNKTINAN